MGTSSTERLSLYLSSAIGLYAAAVAFGAAVSPATADLVGLWGSGALAAAMALIAYGFYRSDRDGSAIVKCFNPNCPFKSMRKLMPTNAVGQPACPSHANDKFTAA